MSLPWYQFTAPRVRLATWLRMLLPESYSIKIDADGPLGSLDPAGRVISLNPRQEPEKRRCWLEVAPRLRPWYTPLLAMTHEQFEWAVIRGVAAHEAGHAHWTGDPVPQPVRHMLINILEDERIEQGQARRWPALAPFFAFVGDVFWANGIPPAGNGQGAILKACLLWRFEHDLPGSLSKVKALEPDAAALWNGEVRPRVEAAWRARTYGEVVALADEILERIEDLAEPGASEMQRMASRLDSGLTDRRWRPPAPMPPDDVPNGRESDDKGEGEGETNERGICSDPTGGSSDDENRPGERESNSDLADGCPDSESEQDGPGGDSIPGDDDVESESQLDRRGDSPDAEGQTEGPIPTDDEQDTASEGEPEELADGPTPAGGDGQAEGKSESQEEDSTPAQDDASDEGQADGPEDDPISRADVNDDAGGCEPHGQEETSRCGHVMPDGRHQDDELPCPGECEIPDDADDAAAESETVLPESADAEEDHSSDVTSPNGHTGSPDGGAATVGIQGGELLESPPVPDETAQDRVQDMIGPRPFADLEERAWPLARRLVARLKMPQPHGGVEYGRSGRRVRGRDVIRRPWTPFRTLTAPGRETPEMVVQILGDRSGSMGHREYSKMAAAQLGVMVLHLACTELDIPHAISLFDDEVLVKDFEDQDEMSKSFIAGWEGETGEEHLDRLLCQREPILLARPEPLKVVMVVHDGYPVVEGEAERIRDWIRRHEPRVWTLGVYLTTDAHSAGAQDEITHMQELFQHLVVADPDDFPERLGDLLVNLAS